SASSSSRIDAQSHGQVFDVQRVEPVIGSLDLEVSAEAKQQARSAARKRRVLHELRNWSTIFGLLGLFVGGGTYYAVQTGGVAYAIHDHTAKCVVLGFFVLYFSQLAGAILVFRLGFVAGALSFLVPGY